MNHRYLQLVINVTGSMRRLSQLFHYSPHMMCGVVAIYLHNKLTILDMVALAIFAVSSPDEVATMAHEWVGMVCLLEHTFHVRISHTASYYSINLVIANESLYQLSSYALVAYRLINYDYRNDNFSRLTCRHECYPIIGMSKCQVSGEAVRYLKICFWALGEPG